MSKIANLIFLVAGIAHAALAPNFAVNPKDTVAVGEEVLFSAMSTHYEENPALLRKARYEWNFGDGYSFKFGSPLSSTNCSGIGVVHYFMRPGAFTVKLTVSVYSTFDSDGNPQGTQVVGSFSKAVTVFGEAPLSGFSLLHASITAHLAQYVYATIPAAYRGNQTSLTSPRRATCRRHSYDGKLSMHCGRAVVSSRVAGHDGGCRSFNRRA